MQEDMSKVTIDDIAKKVHVSNNVIKLSTVDNW